MPFFYDLIRLNHAKAFFVTYTLFSVRIVKISRLIFSIPMEIVGIEYEPIELCKLLKIANLVSGGGEAKMVIAMGAVLLNGEVEIQKRKKVYAGDIVEFNGDVISPTIEASSRDSITIKKTENSASTKTLAKKQSKAQKSSNEVTPVTSAPSKRAGRKPISF